MVEKEVLDSDDNLTPEVSTEEAIDDAASSVSTSGEEQAEVNSADDQQVDLQEQVNLLNEKVLRQAADFQNYRRRMEKANIESVSIGKSMVIQRLLDVLDDLERSIEAADRDAKDGTQQVALKEGVKLVFQKFQDELSRLGVEPIPAEGAHFNEEEHEAMMQQPAPEGIEPGTVIQELQKGYRMGDRILRHSKVIVAS